MNPKRLRALTARGASIALTLALAYLPGSAAGAVINWSPDADGFWDIAANWSSNPLLPGAADDLTINVGGAVVRVITHRTGTTTIRTINNAETVDVTNGSTLQISSGGLASTNTGTLQANNGTLNLINSALNNAGGTLAAINGGVISLSNSSVVGGTLTTSGGGVIRTQPGTTSLLDNVTLNGTYVAGDGSSNTTTRLAHTITNNGTLAMNSGVGGGLRTDVVLATDVTLAGTGTLAMANSGNNVISGLTGIERLTNSAGHTIAGSGNVGNGSIALTNEGLIVATQSTPLIVSPNSSGANNTGTLRADGGTLELRGLFNNTGGTIEALNGSTVQLTNATIVRGTLSTSGGGVIRTAPGSLGFLDDLTISANSVFVAGDGSANTTTRLANAITNNGTLAMNSGVAGNLATSLVLATDVTLTGTGTLAMADRANNVISGLNGTERLTNSAGHTIQGSGNIGAGAMALTNQGLIVATQSTPLIVQPNVGGVTNTGTLRADGGTLDLRGLFTNAGGTIEARNGSTAQLTNTTVVGGTLSTTSGGVIRTTPGTLGVLDGVTLNGTYVAGDGASNTTTQLKNTIVNNGTLAMNSGVGGGLATSLVLATDVTLAGTGTLAMANSGNNVISGLTGTERLTNSASHVIVGSGSIGSGSIALTNLGTITANQPTALIVQPNANGAINAGTMQATNGATLRLVGAFTNFEGATNGLIQALDNPGGPASIVELSGAAVTGGVLVTTGNGVIRTRPGQLGVLDGVTLNGIYVAGDGSSNTTTRLANTITNNGTLAMNSGVGGGLATSLVLATDVTLAGTGTLAMANSGANVISGLTGTERLTNSAGHTIQGSGNIGSAGMALTNQGLIVATQSTPLIVQPNASGAINTGTMRADGGTLDLRGLFTNTGGTIDARNGSTAQLNNATVVGGTLTTSAGGVIRTTPGTLGVLDGVTLNGTYVAGDGSSNTTTRISNAITNNGTLAMNSGVGGGLVTTLQLGTDVTLIGTGTLAMANSVNNFISGQTGTQTLTNASGHTIQGAGQIQVAIVNAGTVRASGSAGLTVGRGITGSTGTIEIATDGRLTFSGATNSSTGTLLHNGSAAGSLSIANTNITVNTDYNNANFGVGNSFNARANVTGTGQILAGGNVAQAITGTNVTNGTTGTATLTIGNVHVGANTFDYQIANAGTTGPALRGALQTAVNGGNITDARISGTGVTASNWGPVAAGGNSGNLSVTFTAASAGALAPLTGQVVHIGNNFSNVAGQNLNIVLGAGAAAYNLAGAFIVPSPASLPNQRVGGTATQALTVTNTAPAGSFTEGLNASFGANSGDALNNGGTISLLAGGASSSAMTVHVDTSTAGFKSGTVTINPVSDGTGTSGLGLTNLSQWQIFVNGNVYQIAQPTVPTTVNLGNVHVGGNLSQSIAIGNTLVAAGFQEGLNVAVGGTTGGATGSGSITNLAAGGSSNAVSVGLGGIAAGNQSGTVTLNLASNGDGTSGLALLNLPSATVTVNATGYNLAQGSATPTPVVLGNQRIGGTATQALTVTNTAPAGAFTEALNATFGANTGNATNNGAAVGLLAGGASNSGMSVGVDTSAAGARSGTVTLNYASDGFGSSGLGVTSVGSQTINVSGNVYQVAQPSFAATTVDLGNVRVGGTAQQALGVTNTNVAPGFQEGLAASIGGATAGITANGSIANLAAGGTDNTSLVVGLDTATSGARNGTATVSLVSTGAGTSGLTDLNLGTQTINVGGNVYQVASGVINTAPLAFTVQVGQNVSQVLSITNNATGAAGFVEDLNARFGASSGTGAAQIGGTGSISGLVAGGTNNTAMTVTVDTSTAGTINGAIAVNFFTAGTVNGASNGLGEAGVGSVAYGVQGLIQATVINTASPVINNSPINLGNVRVGDATPTAFVSVTNQATVEPQAALNASITGNAPITASGSFNLLPPGQANNNSLQVGMNTGTAGAVNGTATIAFVSDASNVGNCEPNCQFNLPSQNVVVTGGVYRIAQPNVPASVDVGNFRIGAAPTQAIAIGNTNNAPAGYQEGLDASIGGTSGRATAVGGPITNLVQGGTSNAIGVGIDNATAIAGINTGTVTLNLASNGTGTSGLATLNLAPATINVTGTGFNAAAGSAAPGTVVIGNQRVGGTGSEVLTITNTAVAGSYSEDLNASFGTSSGNATGTGSISGRLAGTNNTGSGTMTVGVDTTAAGARSGTVTVNYQTAGAVGGASNGLGTADVGSQTITVSGNVYQLAAGQIVTAPLNFTVQVGQAVSRDLVIRNTATGASGFVEDLNASFGLAGDARITGTGTLTGILAGTNSTAANGTMTVHVDTSAAGSINSGIAVNFVSAGAVNGVGNGLGTLGVGSENYAVIGSIQATVVDQARPVINGVPNPGTVDVNLGNVRIGAAAEQTLTVLNQATGNQQAALNASIASNGAPVTASGSFNLLAPGATSNALSVGIDTSAAGARSGAATVSLVSDASNIGGCEPNCQLVLPSQTVNVSANVYRLANPVLNTGTVTIAARVGDAVGATQGVSITNSSPDIYTEGLRVDITGAAGNAQHNGGAIANLAAQGTDGSSIRVGLGSTAVAGITNGTVSLGYVSTGAGTTGAADLAVGAGTVTVTGKVYTPAQAQLANTTIDFGIVHVGDVVGPIALNVSNIAPASALNDTLRASFGAVGGPFSGTGAITGLAAGASDGSSMTVGLNTANAGVFNGAGSVALASHNDDMADLALSPGSLILAAQVNNYANPVFTRTGGAGSLTGSGDAFALDLGDLLLGSGLTSASLGVLNDVLGPADFVSGSFDLSGADDFALSGFGAFSDLGAGDLFAGLLAGFAANSLGSFDDTIVLNALAYNASGYRQQMTLTLLLHADVVSAAVPEPSTIALLLAALALLGYASRRRNAARAR